MLGRNSTSGPSPARESRSCCQEKQKETTNCYPTTPKCTHLSNSSEKINFSKPEGSELFHSVFSQDAKEEKIRQEWRYKYLTSLHLTLAVSFLLLVHLHFRYFSVRTTCPCVSAMRLKVFICVQVRNNQDPKSKPKAIPDELMTSAIIPRANAGICGIWHVQCGLTVPFPLAFPASQVAMHHIIPLPSSHFHCNLSGF